MSRPQGRAATTTWVGRTHRPLWPAYPAPLTHHAWRRRTGAAARPGGRVCRSLISTEALCSSGSSLQAVRARLPAGQEAWAWSWPPSPCPGPAPLPRATRGTLPRARLRGPVRPVTARRCADGPAPAARARRPSSPPDRRFQVPGAGPDHRLESLPEDHPERRSQDRHVPERRLGPPGRRGRALPV